MDESNTTNNFYLIDFYSAGVVQKPHHKYTTIFGYSYSSSTIFLLVSSYAVCHTIPLESVESIYRDGSKSFRHITWPTSVSKHDKTLKVGKIMDLYYLW